MKIAVLASYTLKSIEFEGHEWFVSQYSDIHKQIFEKDSELKKFNPDVILLSIDPWDNEDILKMLEALEKMDTFVFVHSAVETFTKPFIFFNDFNDADQYNSLICDFVYGKSKFRVLRVDHLVYLYGAKKIFDPRMYYLGKIKFSAFGAQKMKEQFQQAIELYQGNRKKCLVLDLDNTLWGGLAADGIQLADDGPYKAFYDFQKTIKWITKNGIILAICSKNDEKTTMDIIENHPYMILRKDDFAAWRINWNDKAANIREIAEELNVGLDSMVFLDDSEFERETVRQMLPEVTVPDLPSDSAYYTDFISNLYYLDAISITEEDMNRVGMYTQTRKRKVLESNFSSYEDFLKDLEIKIIVMDVNSHSKERVKQLTERTNQFNFSGKKFDNFEDCDVFVACYNDKVGSQGIIGTIIVKDYKVEGFYMSCRILGRGVENAFFELVMNLYSMKPEVEFVETVKNHAAKKFFDEYTTIRFTGEDRYEIQELKGTPEWIEISFKKY